MPRMRPPSSSLSSLLCLGSPFWSSQSERRTSQSGRGKLTLSPVIFVSSATVNQLLGNGLVVGLRRSNSACTPPTASAGETNKVTLTTQNKKVVDFEVILFIAPPVIPKRANSSTGSRFQWERSQNLETRNTAVSYHRAADLLSGYRLR